MIARSSTPTDKSKPGIWPGQWLLAIDTSSDQAGIALFDGVRLHSRQWPAARAQTTQVLPMIRQMLEFAAVTLTDLGAVAVATGPGAFTGLRVGVSLAKGFALGGRIPLIGIPTLKATAMSWTKAGLTVIALLPAGRGRLVWQWFGSGDLQRDADAGPHNTTPLELVEAAERLRVDAIVGELTDPLRQELAGVAVPMITGAESPARIDAVATLAFERWIRGERDDPARLEPQYVHGVRAARHDVRDPLP